MSDSAIQPELLGIAEAADLLEGLEALPCDGRGHPIENAEACMHIRCTLLSPRREELLAAVGPVARKAQFERVMLIHRTEANPGYTDLSIDPSDRAYGSIQGGRPDIQNYGSSGFANPAMGLCRQPAPMTPGCSQDLALPRCGEHYR